MANDPGLSEIVTTTARHRSKRMAMPTKKTPVNFTKGGAANGGSSTGGMLTKEPPAYFMHEGAGHTPHHKSVSGSYQREAHPKTTGVNRASGVESGGYTHGAFTPPPASNAHVFKGTQKKGVLRTSGKGHMLGCKR